MRIARSIIKAGIESIGDHFAITELEGIEILYVPASRDCRLFVRS